MEVLSFCFVGDPRSYPTGCTVLFVWWGHPSSSVNGCPPFLIERMSGGHASWFHGYDIVFFVARYCRIHVRLQIHIHKGKPEKTCKIKPCECWDCQFMGASVTTWYDVLELYIALFLGPRNCDGLASAISNAPWKIICCLAARDPSLGAFQKWSFRTHQNQSGQNGPKTVAHRTPWFLWFSDTSKYGFWLLVSVCWGWGNPQAAAGGTL